ncbi:MAG: hypothetical protein JWO67_6442 [Streptosporangiaceae bacterium]|nr:hypothetical protein [Streptosporangiaceae bacterium]
MAGGLAAHTGSGCSSGSRGATWMSRERGVAASTTLLGAGDGRADSMVYADVVSEVTKVSCAFGVLSQRRRY